MIPIDLYKLIVRFENCQKEINDDKSSTIKECILINDIVSYLREHCAEDCGIKPESEWVLYKNEAERNPPYHCVQCGWYAPSAGYHVKYYNFCPNCGAKMKQNFTSKII